MTKRTLSPKAARSWMKFRAELQQALAKIEFTNFDWEMAMDDWANGLSVNETVAKRT